MTFFFPVYSLSHFLPCHISTCISLISAHSPFCLYEHAVWYDGNCTLLSGG
jgi:hypothetical protein